MKIKKSLFLRPMHIKHVQAPTDMRTNSHPQLTMNSQFLNLLSSRRRCIAGLWALLLVVCTLGLALPAQAQIFEAISKSAISDESCLPANGVIDPGETNTMTFRFKNKKGNAITNVRVRMRTGVPTSNSSDPSPVGTSGGAWVIVPGVPGSTGSSNGEVAVSGTIANDGEFEATFRFRVDGDCGSTFRPTFVISYRDSGASSDAAPHDTGDGNAGLREAGRFGTFQLGQTVETEYNFTGGGITIRDNNTGNPYPSSITIASGAVPNVSGVPGERVARVEVTLKGVTHGFARDVNVMLRGANNNQVVLMREAGGNTSTTAGISNADITFAQNNDLPLLPVSSQITTGRYRPSDFLGSSIVFRGASADEGGLPTPDKNLNTAFENSDAAGQWRLFVFDDSITDSGSIASWDLKIITKKIVCCGAGATVPTITSGSGTSRSAGIGNLTGNSARNEDSENIDVDFEAFDLETGANLTFRATSANQSLVQDAQLEINDRGDGDARTRRLRVKKLVANANGTVAITVFAKDGSDNERSATFNLEIKPVNDAPRFLIGSDEADQGGASAGRVVRNQSLNIGTRTPPLSFSIRDVEDTDPNNLVVTASSSDQTVVPNANIFLAGSGANRTVQVIPSQEGTGGTGNVTPAQATITLAVRDNSGAGNENTPTAATTTTTFIVRFEAARNEPTISPVNNQTVEEDKVLRVPFTVRPAVQPDSGAQTTADGLVVTRSAHSTLFTSVSVGGAGNERELVFTPAPNKTGSENFTITVSDGVKSRSTAAFTVTVTEVNDAPTITGLPTTQINIAEDSATAEIPFTIGDVETTDFTLANWPFVAGSPDTAFPAGGTSSSRRINIEILGTSGIVPLTFVNNDTDPGLKVGSSADGVTRTIRVKPNPDRFGRITVRVTIFDGTSVKTGADAGKPGDGTTGTGTFVVNIDGINDPPILGRIFRNGVKDVSPAPAGWPVDNPNASPTPAVTFADNAADAVIQVDEDGPTLDGDGNPREAHLLITGMTAGPTAEGGKEFDQTITLSLTRDDPNGVIQSVSFDKTTVQESLTGSVDSNFLKIKLNKEKFGNVDFTITAADSAGASTSKKFRLTVNGINDDPKFNNNNPGSTFSLFSTDREVGKGQALVVPITLSDVETSSGNFSVVTATSSNQAVVQNSNVVIDGSKSRVTIIAEANATTDATTLITLQFRDRGAADNGTTPGTVSGVSNGPKNTAIGTFVAKAVVIPENGPPTITIESPLGTTRESTTIQEDAVATAFVVIADTGSNQTALSDLTLSATSVGNATEDGQPLVPVQNILFGGSGGTRTVAFVPRADRSGTATITVTVTDKGVTIGNATEQNRLSASKTFTLTVTAIEDAPTISLKQAGPFYTDENAEVEDKIGSNKRTDSGFIELSIGDAETAADNLTLSRSIASSAHRDIIPENNVTFERAGSTVRVRITPAANRNTLKADGSNDPVLITVKVKDAAGNETELAGGIRVFVRAKNSSPDFTIPGTQNINENAGLITLQITGITAGPLEQGPLRRPDSANPPVTADRAMILRVRADAVTTADDTASGLVNNDGTVQVGGASEQLITITDASTTATATVTFRVDSNESGAFRIRVRVDERPAVSGDDATNASVSQSGGENGKEPGVSPALATATDAKTTTKRLTVNVAAVNTAPTFTSAIQDQSTQQDTAIGPIAINIADQETAAADLTLSFSSSNTALVPNNTTDPTQPGMTPTGSGSARGVIIRPAAGASGSTVITVVLRDTGDGAAAPATATNSFRLNVVAGERPLISSIPNQTINASQFTDVIQFTVNDAQTTPAALTVRGESLNTAIVSNSDIQFGPVDTAAPTQRTLIVRGGATPGSADIRVTVRDSDGQESSTLFKVTIRGEPPTIALGFPSSLTVQTNGTTGTLSFTVADKETFPGFLRVTAGSSNSALVPTANISLGGSGSNRTVAVALAANQGGSSVITLTVTDNEGQSASATFTVATPIPANDPPTISNVVDQATDIGRPTGLINVTVGDAGPNATAAASLTLTASSSNKTLVPDGNIFTGGTGASRTVFIQPADNQSGETTITLTVTDQGPGTPKTASTSFKLVVAANQSPTITAIANQTIERNRSTSSLSFTVGDAETTAASLVVTVASDNTTLVPGAGIALSGTGATRSVVVTPARDQSGTARITLTVTDGGNKTATSAFTVTVTAPASVKGDFNGDGQPDLLFQDNAGFLAIWLDVLNKDKAVNANFLIPSNIGDTGFKIVGSADLNRDGKEDILFQHTDGTLAAWLMDGTLQVSATLLDPSNPGDRNWRVAATGDINRDGKSDLVFQHTDGTLAVWNMDGTKLASAALINPSHPGDRNWRVVGTGDLNADGKADLIFQHSDGTLATWRLDGANLTSAALLDPSHPGDAKWRVVSVAQYGKPFGITLSGAAERPTPVVTAATGSGTATLAGTRLTFDISYSGLSGAATQAHIHGAATSEQFAGVIVDLSPHNGGAFGTSGKLAGSVELTPAQAALVRDGLTYVNIHTAANTGGELRGQILPSAAKASQVDLVFQHEDSSVAIWFLDGGKLRTPQLITTSGTTWKALAPK